MGDAEDIDAEATEEKTKTWYFVVPLQTKVQEECIAALESVITSIRKEYGGADVVYRIHGDRASELTGEGVVEHFRAQHIAVTKTPGFEPSANGRAERAVG